VALHPACHAVENYLASMFPRSVIEEFEWGPRRCWVFKVNVPSLSFQLLVSTRFLDETPDYEIERRLADWHVAQWMRLRPNGRAREWTVVTAGGVTQATPESACGD
jgi:hypothetical protein